MSAVKKKPVVSKVWNDNKYPHTEKFKGQMITIMPSINFKGISMVLKLNAKSRFHYPQAYYAMN